MDFNELKRINDILKVIRQLQELRKVLDQVNDVRRHQEIIRHFLEEQKDQFWRGEKPTEQDLEMLREKAGYDKKLWQEIVRELLGEKPPSGS